MTRLLFATDLHGNLQAYDLLWEQAAILEVDAVVLGGDLLPLPRGRQADWLSLQCDFLDETLVPALRRFHAERPGVSVYGLLGNDDWVACEEVLAALEPEGAYHPLHQRSHRLDDEHWIAGYSCVPLTPFAISDWDRYDSAAWQPAKEPRTIRLSDTGEVREATLRDVRLKGTIEEEVRALPGLSDPRQTVYVTHSPPHGTKLDLMHGKRPIGSAALRRFIEEHQPPLTLHGHVHESPRLSGSISDRLGRTVCVNPGDSRTRLRAVLLDLDDPAGSLRLVG